MRAASHEPEVGYSRVNNYYWYGPHGLWPGESHPNEQTELTGDDATAAALRNRYFRSAAQDTIFATKLRTKKGSKTQRKR